MSDKQYDLYKGHPPHVQQYTSFEAASKIKDKALNLREVVFHFIASRGMNGATDEEMQEGLEMNPSTQRPRRRELALKHRIVDGGERRLTRSGRRAIVWIRSS